LHVYPLFKPTTEHWHDKELHLSITAMTPFVLTASKVVRLPLLDHELEALPASLCHVGQHLRPC